MNGGTKLFCAFIDIKKKKMYWDNLYITCITKAILQACHHCGNPKSWQWFYDLLESRNAALGSMTVKNVCNKSVCNKIMTKLSPAPSVDISSDYYRS